ncbi:hypothetical protein HA466_0121270 [Hirschfeldia incana]|nr:hypothetical protein HA466_0121270 [Hirschfeldia incana]KAJ0253027.1 hypothetical protein HA466_0121270 [Hirschfeldia incana]
MVLAFRRASQAYSGTDDIGARIAVSDDGVLHKDWRAICPTSTKSASFSGFFNYMELGSEKSVRKWKALDHQGDSDAALLPIHTNQARSSNNEYFVGTRSVWSANRIAVRSSFTVRIELRRGNQNGFSVKSVAHPFKLQFEFFFYVFL